MFKQGDVILIGEDAPVRAYVGTIFRMLEDMREVDNGVFPLLKGRAEVLKTEVRGLQGRGGVELKFTERWIRALKKIGEGDIYVGQKVRIREDSQFYGRGHSNPVDVVGEVTNFRSDGWLPLAVMWENGFSNTYSLKDLEVVAEAPKPRKKAK